MRAELTVLELFAGPYHEPPLFDISSRSGSVALACSLAWLPFFDLL